MGKIKTIGKSFSQLTKQGLDAVRKKLIAEEKARNGYLVVGDKKGKVKKIPAKDL